jgi:antitoxin (DNA-binding transcriptional repressor) of toxin-antitoxin stability system
MGAEAPDRGASVVSKVYTVLTSYSEYMGGTPRMGIREIRAGIGERVDAAYFLGEPTIITKNDKPRAVLVSHAWYERACRALGEEPETAEPEPVD